MFITTPTTPTHIIKRLEGTIFPLAFIPQQQPPLIRWKECALLSSWKHEVLSFPRAVLGGCLKGVFGIDLVSSSAVL